MSDKKFLMALKHREITLMHYELDARRDGDEEGLARVQELLVALRANIATPTAPNPSQTHPTAPASDTTTRS